MRPRGHDVRHLTYARGARRGDSAASASPRARMSSRRLTALVAATSLLLLLPLLLLARTAHGQQPAPASPPGVELRIPDSLHTQVLELSDGSTLVGRITAVEADSVRFATAVTTMTLPRAAIVKVREIRNPTRSTTGEIWLPDPGVTRLLFAPTGRMLERGDGYFSNAYLFFLSFFAAPTNRLTIGGGMSILPTDNFVEDNVYYLMPKVGLVHSDRLNIAAGGLIGAVPGDEGGSGGIGYGVATFGPAHGNLTVGAGVAFGDGGVVDEPLLMVGFYKRLSRRTAFVSENYGIPGVDGILFSYGVRFFGEKLSVDFALWNSSEIGVFPGIPYIAFAKHF